MNKTYFNLLAVLTLGSLTSSIFAVNYPIELRNNYGATVEFIEMGSGASQAAPHQINKLPNGATTRLTNFFYEDSLSLRTVGGSFRNVSYIFNQIQAETRQHPNQIAIITINYSYNPISWSLSVSWK